MLFDVHFMRPWWFLALIPTLVLFIGYWLSFNRVRNNWQLHCDAHLLPYILDKNTDKGSRLLYILLLCSWLLAIFALVGPTWSKNTQQVYQKNVARVIALDVSTSMNAVDLSPSRMQRAKYKIIDLLKSMKEGQVGMLVFSSQPFVVSPLTSDSNTIAELVPVIDTNIVPVQGSNMSNALLKAAQLLQQAGLHHGSIILVTDSSPDSASLITTKKLATIGYNVSVLGIGTVTGAPVTNGSNGTFITNAQGNIVFDSLDVTGLQTLAHAGDGVYVPFTLDNTDINTLLAHENNMSKSNQYIVDHSLTTTLWHDEGHLIIWLLMFIAVFIGRKGWFEQLC